MMTVVILTAISPDSVCDHHESYWRPVPSPKAVIFLTHPAASDITTNWYPIPLYSNAFSLKRSYLHYCVHTVFFFTPSYHNFSLLPNFPPFFCLSIYLSSAFSFLCISLNNFSPCFFFFSFFFKMQSSFFSPSLSKIISVSLLLYLELFVYSTSSPFAIFSGYVVCFFDNFAIIFSQSFCPC